MKLRADKEAEEAAKLLAEKQRKYATVKTKKDEMKIKKKNEPKGIVK